MRKEMKIELEIVIDNREAIKLTMDEARAVYAQLNELFGKSQPCYIPNPIYYETPQSLITSGQDSI